MLNKKIIIYCLLIGITAIGCQLIRRGPRTILKQGKKYKLIEPDISILTLMKDFIKVTSGTFTMGSNIKKDTKPIHQVYLKTFYISKCEVTVEAYTYFLNQTGYKYDYGVNERSSIRYINGKYYIKEKEKSYPVVNVTWEDANEFCNWLSQRSGEKIELPTEAQWEKAARGGNYSEGYLYSGSNNADEVAWYSKKVQGKISPVGQKSPNELGIYDMSGNVWEWCKDWYKPDYYAVSPKKDPAGPTLGNNHVYRGGSWYLTDDYLNPAIRYYLNDNSCFADLGFRIAKNINIFGNKKFITISPRPGLCSQTHLKMACASVACGMLMRYWSNRFFNKKRIFRQKSCRYSKIFKDIFGTNKGSAENWEDILSALEAVGNDKRYLNVEKKNISIRTEAFQLHGGGHLKLLDHISTKNYSNILRKTVSPWDRPAVLTYVSDIELRDKNTVIESHAVLVYGYSIETTESGYTLWFKVLDGRKNGRYYGNTYKLPIHFTNDHEYTNKNPTDRFFKNTKNRLILIWPEIKQ